MKKYLFLIDIVNLDNVDNGLRCGIRSRISKNKKILAAHLKYHHSDEKFQCGLCSRILKNKKTLAAHLKNHHSDERKFQCDQCPKKFNTSSDCRKHLITHSNEKKFRCETCQQIFERNHDLIRQKLKKHRGLYGIWPVEFGHTNAIDKLIRGY